MRDRWRYRIARTLDRLPGQCRWSLREWAERAVPRSWPWSSNTKACRRRRDQIGVCPCGKLRLPEIQAELDRLGAGPCSATWPLLIGDGELWCELRHGHAGDHESGPTRWKERAS
ncbi:hypothetical protein OHA21_43750 [Actinoplanes sp. NBC_00393]|uniref:hypothetical protein n=1 Tax=Actinoplanes sp. NBC_00393 TaxID=2975953 RepID=UPI002E1C1BC4